MSEKPFTKLKGGVVKRTKKRVLGVFVDGSSLDRATRRMQKRVDLARLLRGVSAGGVPTVARYYTIVPHEDDSRQRAFLDAVRNSGFEVILKRLPPIGVTRQVSVEIEMASDMIAFGLGQNSFDNIGFSLPENDSTSGKTAGDKKAATKGSQNRHPAAKSAAGEDYPLPEKSSSEKFEPKRSAAAPGEEERIVTVVCAARALTYPFRFLTNQGIQTVTADFAQSGGRELLKSASKWIDLSDSETIWKD